MFFSFLEIIYLFILIFSIALIFSESFEKEEIKSCIIAAGLGVVLHELAHKFVALYFGHLAFFEISFLGLALGLFLRFINSPFIIIIPGWVSIFPLHPITPFERFLISLSGPLTNLLLYFVFKFLYLRIHSKFWKYVCLRGERINLWLFIFNMLPIPPLDGFKVFSSLISLLS